MKKAAIYVSRALVPFDGDLLQTLAKQSAAANAEHGVSGYLYFESEQFLQYIEGDHAKLDQLIKNIAKDDRHHIVNLVVDDDLMNYRFLAWHMRFLTKEDLKTLSLEKMMMNIVKNAEPNTEKGNVHATEKRLWKMANLLANAQWKLTGLATR